MMPYAANDKVSTDDFEGAIKISQAQYLEAIEGVCKGWVVSIEDGFKVAPPEPTAPTPVPEPTLEELRARALAQRDQLLAQAAVRIAPLQYAVDRGDANSAEKASLIDWQDYCITLNRIERQAKFPQTIEWPTPPGANPEV